MNPTDFHTYMTAHGFSPRMIRGLIFQASKQDRTENLLLKVAAQRTKVEDGVPLDWLEEKDQELYAY